MITAMDARHISINSPANKERMEKESVKVKNQILAAANLGKFEVCVTTSLSAEELARLFSGFQIVQHVMGPSKDPRETPYITMRW